MSQQLQQNKHLCFSCALTLGYEIKKTPVKVTKNKCQKCKCSKEGLTLNKFSLREDK